MKKLILLASLGLSISVCGQFKQIVSKLPTSLSGTSTKSVSNTENVAGLKNSLIVGIEKAVANLGAENGFYKNEALKLLLPPEAQPIMKNIKMVPGGQGLVDKTVLAMNRTAEDAVKEATPIFKTAITNMSVTDAVGILFGNNNAATEYLRKTTYSQLKAAFAPKVKTSLDKPLVANASTTETWNTLSSGYNKVAKTTAGSIYGMKTVNVDMENYVTEKALDALFIKVADEEKAIRSNPSARVNDLLKKVFGQLDKK